MKDRLVLIEGLPGMGKTTTCKKLYEAFPDVSRRVYLETSTDCPLGYPWSFETARDTIFKLGLKSYPYESWGLLDAGFSYFVESKFLQNAALFLFVKGHSREDLLQMSLRILEKTQRMNVSCVYLRSENIRDVLKRTIAEREVSCPAWFPFVEKLFSEQAWYGSQPVKEKSAFVQTMVAWSAVQEWILDQLELNCIWVNDPQLDRDRSYSEIEKFVRSNFE